MAKKQEIEKFDVRKKKREIIALREAIKRNGQGKLYRTFKICHFTVIPDKKDNNKGTVFYELHPVAYVKGDNLKVLKYSQNVYKGNNFAYEVLLEIKKWLKNEGESLERKGK